MIDQEPTISVGILEHRREIRGVARGPFAVGGRSQVTGAFTAAADGGGCILSDEEGCEIARGQTITMSPLGDSRFMLRDVTIGVQFHWERNEDQLFGGGLTLVAGDDGLLVAVNVIAVEEYLKSVISSEMSAEAPLELLKAHAITSRSWLVAMLEREHRNIGIAPRRARETSDEIIRWYDREDHGQFDVCADDHCQRYQGETKIVSPEVRKAVDATRGLFLIDADRICDARFSKSCGGITEEFQNVWEDLKIPYLTAVTDAQVEVPHPRGREEAEQWIRSSPRAFCNTNDAALLRQILPSFDQETTDFFRWTVNYSQSELRELLALKSGIEFGSIRSLVPLERGPSGRIIRLRIEGTQRTLVVGKELEIRRWLSKSHLYSSAFVVEAGAGTGGIPASFTLRGAGWGHGVGLCQIGAAVMASEGFSAERIVLHYFRNASLRKCYP